MARFIVMEIGWSLAEAIFLVEQVGSVFGIDQLTKQPRGVNSLYDKTLAILLSDEVRALIPQGTTGYHAPLVYACTRLPDCDAYV